MTTNQLMRLKQRNTPKHGVQRRRTCMVVHAVVSQVPAHAAEKHERQDNVNNAVQQFDEAYAVEAEPSVSRPSVLHPNGVGRNDVLYFSYGESNSKRLSATSQDGQFYGSLPVLLLSISC